MSKEYGVGIIGCGNISGAYFKLIPMFRNLKLVACADINPAASKARSEEFGVEAQEIDALLAKVPAVNYGVVTNEVDTAVTAHLPSLGQGANIDDVLKAIDSQAQGQIQ